MIGTQVGPYRVIARIGEGGMGAVYEAVDEQIGKRVAIKVLHKEHAKNQQISNRFINEARAINVVEHPGIVTVSSFGQLPDGTAYIVMELLKGETLNARMKAQGGRMQMLDALRLARQIASALAAAHEKGIIHRDLKPDNIMLVADSAMPGGERTKLLDFGIAKLKQEYQGSGDQVMTRAGVMMGTPLYMAPEQCRNASDVDDKADVYSLGVMLYRMLAGKPPFAAPGTGELMAMHIYMQPPPLQAANPALPEPLVALVHRMLAKNRVERPSMAQVAQELEQLGTRFSAMVPALTPALVAKAAGSAGFSVNESATVLSDNSNLLATRPTPRPALPVQAVGGQGSRGRLFIIIGIVLVLLSVGAVLALRTLRPRTPPAPAPTHEPVTPPAKPGTEHPPAAASKLRRRLHTTPSGAQVPRLDTA
ncbi:MAG TPA: serine/threonine-protein kinase, partial [Pseudomonadota bacterium]|nr:serine/threonine-protein kinase [Pseudomonadota bacterium]